MKFDIKNSKLVYEVRYLGNKKRWMHEQLYRTKEGTYFIYFEGGAESRYGIRVGCFKDKGRSGNYSMNEEEISLWKGVSALFKKEYPRNWNT